jgi:iron complex transport system substrate-binding protein
MPSEVSRSSTTAATRRVLALAALGVCLVFAACGDNGDGDAAPASTDGQSAYPVTIRSKHGSATITQRPARVVTLDNQATDDALALGVTPVAIPKVTYVPGDMQVWTKQALSGKQPRLINIDNGIPYEQVAALRPDLILATNTFPLEEKSVYDRVRRIAPTVHFAKGSLGDTWQDVMRRVGQSLGQEDRATELIDGAERDLAAVRERTPEFEGKTVNFFNADPSGLYAINESSDYSMRFLAGLGLRLSPRLAALKGDGGRAGVSAERYGVLDSDLLIGTSTVPKALAKLERSTLFKRIAAVRDGRYASLGIGPATSMAFPSLLSVRYATKDVVPKLEAAIKGDG